MRWPTLFIIITFLFNRCQPSEPPATSFYFWKTTFELSPSEKKVIKENHAKRLYVRYCDVVLKDGKAVPESPILFREKPGSLDVVPVVYIKNEVMLSDHVDVVPLAEQLSSFIRQINMAHNIKPAELQFDCDWSEKSKAKYFRFLELMQTKNHYTLSATIRLHQIKYPERTGVPPVQKGVLMYYNMGRISIQPSNSIYERSTAMRYLDRLADYPLALDIALPIFVWGVHIRDNRVIGLLRDVDAEAFRTDDRFQNLTGPFFQASGSTIKKGYHFQKGDRIKIESISEQELREMITDLKQKIKRKPAEVIYYDLDKFNLKQFKHEGVFEKISADF